MRLVAASVLSRDGPTTTHDPDHSVSGPGDLRFVNATRDGRKRGLWVLEKGLGERWGASQSLGTRARDTHTDMVR
jgi:hypothetical protein